MQDTDRIKEALDIVDIVGEHVQLRPAGSHFRGLCPFHREKSPSFMVSRERKSWHCFGCGKGGDIFSFIMEVDGMEFREALEHLARRSGITLSRSVQEKDRGGGRNALKSALLDASKLWQYLLSHPLHGAEAREYLLRRGMTESDMLFWGVGFAPKAWDVLLKALLKRGHSVDVLFQAGLIVKKDGGAGRYFDRFRDRIMFPIRSVQGDVVGFTGRLLHESEEAGGKYVNTPETALYNKSQVIFGLHAARQFVREAGYAVLVEGQMDVIASHRAGVKQAVAVSGTAFTVEQAKLLRRYTEEVRMAFDGDSAGVQAALRSVDVLYAAGIRVRAICIPDGAGKDPDECVKKDKDIWVSAVDGAEDMMEWLMGIAEKMHDIKTAHGKRKAAEMVLLRIAVIVSDIEKDHYLRMLSDRLQVGVDVLRSELRKMSSDNSNKIEKKDIADTVKAVEVSSPADSHLARFLVLLFTVPGLRAPFDGLPLLHTVPGLYASLAEKARSVYTPDNNLFALVRPLLSEEEYQCLDILLHKGDFTSSPIPLSDAERDIDILKKRIAILVLQEQLSLARSAGDVVRGQALLSELQNFST